MDASLKPLASTPYTTRFYERIRSGANRSAEVIAPLVLGLLQVRSVLDVGCGDGTWLAAFQKLGVRDILGIDGNYVPKEILQIPADCFRPVDLAKPFRVERSFDLAISLEVAEHLPPEAAGGLVGSLTQAAPAVLFSAAIPHQRGDNHINEQWPDYWATLFGQCCYIAIDCIRPRIWRNEAVEHWYAQNTLLFVRKDMLEHNRALQSELERTDLDRLSLVHPTQYLFLERLYREAVARATSAERQIPPPGVIAASRLLTTRVRSAIQWRLLGKR